MDNQTEMTTPNRTFIIALTLGVVAVLVSLAGLIFWLLSTSTKTHPAVTSKPAPQGPTEDIGAVKKVSSKYKVATGQANPNGWFTTGQDADIMLSGIDFNNTGGALQFNHPGGVASDGTHLLLADRNNNRILIWNSLPTDNKAPDLVLGQKNFTTNTPGTGLGEMNWPVSVTAAQGKVLVTDTYNDRILVWDTFPTSNGQAADLELKGDRLITKRAIGWPWAVWTNGEKLVVTSTAGSSVAIWNRFPTANNQPADIVLKANGQFGTPRSIASDGQHLVIGDHNAKVSGGAGNFFWKTFPTKDDQPYDFFVGDVGRMGEDQPGQQMGGHGDVFWGGMTSDGKLIGITNLLYLWNAFPQNDQDGPSLKIGGVPGRQGYDFGGSQSGDGTSVVSSGGKLYISLSNGNKIVGYNTFPTRSNQKPDFAIGAPDIETNTLATNYFITNGVPATDGQSLFVASDFDRKLYVWKQIPDESGAKPDFVYPFGGWDIALFNQTLAVVNRESVLIWSKLPTDGAKPDRTLEGKIGSVSMQGVCGVTMDDRYFYLADGQAGRVYVWAGIPTPTSEPKYTLTVKQACRLSSDGTYLAVTTTLDNETGHVKVFKINELSLAATPRVVDHRKSGYGTNLPQKAVVSHGHFFIADTNFNRVLAWRKVDDYLAGQKPDTILGADSLEETIPELGRNKLFWPAGLAFDGIYLWVGEFKFGNRLLRFSLKE